MLSQILSILIASHLAYAAPLPAVITRVHTAEAVTTTQTHTTGTTTVFLPPVELLISNGVSYTFTLTDLEWNTYATTQTSIYNDEQKIDSAPALQTTSTAAPVATQTVTTQTSTPQTSTPQTSTPQTATPLTTQIAQATLQATQQATTITSTQQVATLLAAAQQASTLTTLTTIQQATTQQATTQQTTTQQTTTQQATTEQATTEQATTLTTQTSTQQATTQQTTTSTQANSATSASNGLISAPSTIVYSPYQDDGSCKTVDAIASDLEVISGKGIKKIRVYGTDCNNFSGILPKCAELGISVNQGVWFSSAGVSSIDLSVADIISYGEANGWSVFELITIGNEAVNDGYVSVSDLISKISSVKLQLQSSGYTGQVTTSEPPVSFENNPTLCTDSDIDVVGINPHSYFDSGVDASQAGTFVMGQKAIVEGICGLKQVIITETGYPSQGNTNGLNVPSAANQKIAIASLIKESGGDLTILTTYNDYWKTPGPYGIEQYFGAITLFN